MKQTIVLFVIFFLGSSAVADESGKDDAKPLLFSEKGRLSFPVTTSSKEAQAFFEQGMTLHYGFNHAEALRSFRRAGELDPKLAMAWWGLGLALGPNYNRDIDPVDEKRNLAAYEATQKAVKLSEYASPREKAMIHALAKRYSLEKKAEGAKLERDYRLAMSEVMKQFPDDLNAATLYAEAIMNLRPWKLWNPDGKPAEDTEEAVAVLEQVLRRDPTHIGACHYHIHALEASPFPERALPSADRLLHQVPWQSHLTHMPGHIYIHTGDFDKAALSNELALAADEEYFRQRPHKGLFRLMYYPHNIHFLAFARVCQGDHAKAMKAANKLSYFVEPELDSMPMLEGFSFFPLVVQLRFHRWDDVLAHPEPGAKRVPSRMVRHFARAIAFASKGKSTEAEQEQKEFEKLAALIPADAPMGTNSAGQIVDVIRKTLAARLAPKEKAIALWREVVKAEDALNYGEPPDWIFRARESLGAALLRAGQAKEAEQVFREELTRLRRSGRALFGLMHALRDQKRMEEARLVQREWQAAWPSDTPLRMEDY